MSAYVPFLVLGLTETALAGLSPPLVAVPLLWAGLATTYVSAAYFLKKPHMLGKMGGSRVSTAALLPYHAFVRGTAVATQRFFLQQRAEVVPGLWVGSWPRGGAPDHAQLDVTAELPRRGEALRYHCVPMLDGAAAHPEHLEQAVLQAVRWRAEGLPVLVHCAHGRGRSVAVVCGVLMAEGRADNWQFAYEIVRQARPAAHLTRAQQRMLYEASPRLLGLRSVDSASPAAAGSPTAAAGPSGPTRSS